MLARTLLPAGIGVAAVLRFTAQIMLPSTLDKFCCVACERSSELRGNRNDSIDVVVEIGAWKSDVI